MNTVLLVNATIGFSESLSLARVLFRARRKINHTLSKWKEMIHLPSLKFEKKC